MTIVFTTKSLSRTSVTTPSSLDSNTRDFIKNMTTVALQMGTALIMVPADGRFASAIAKDNHKEGEIQGQIRQHSTIDQHLGSETDPHQREQDSVRRCRLQARKVLRKTSNETRSVLIKIGSEWI